MHCNKYILQDLITHTSVKMFWPGTDQNQKQQFYLNDGDHHPAKCKQ